MRKPEKSAKTKRLGSVEQDFTMGPNFAYRSFAPHGILLGSAFPKPCICSAFAEATASADQPFSQMKEETNDQNLQHTETYTHRKNPSGR